MTLQLGQHRKSKFRGNFEREKKLASLMCWAQLLWQQRLTGALNIAHVFGERHANEPRRFHPDDVSSGVHLNACVCECVEWTSGGIGHNKSLHAE